MLNKTGGSNSSFEDITIKNKEHEHIEQTVENHL